MPPTGNPGVSNPAKRPHYRSIPEWKRCRAMVGTGNFYRWSKRCHRQRVMGVSWWFCAEHEAKAKAGERVEMVKR